MEKPTTPAGEEVETVDTAEGISTRISTRIIRISNLRDQNSEGKLLELQPRNATAVGGPDTMQTSEKIALRHFAAFARCKGMCWLFVNVPRMFQGDLVIILKVLVMLMDLRMERMKINFCNLDPNCCRTERRLKQGGEQPHLFLRR